jgi:lipopolysaccharide/colanic/teichoic acid biosynthesis glycosyltransferase
LADNVKDEKRQTKNADETYEELEEIPVEGIDHIDTIISSFIFLMNGAIIHYNLDICGVNMWNELIKRHKLAIAFLGDIVVFILSALIVLYVRYHDDHFQAQLSVHTEPFLIVLVLWLIGFYVFNLYAYKAFSGAVEIAKRLSTTLFIDLSVTIAIFYIFSRFFGLTPKANLVLLAIVFGILDVVWRYVLRKIFVRKQFRSNILMLTSSAISPSMREVIEQVRTNPQLGYSLHIFDGDISTLASTIQRDSITQIVIDGKYLRNSAVTKTLYGILSKRIEMTAFTDFYESILGRIPLQEIEESWFIREITRNRKLYESTNHLVEIILILFILPVVIPVFIVLSIFVAMTFRGSIIDRQERVGGNDLPFTIYKFRVCKAGEDEPSTLIGRFLRRTHLEEIPQLWNVIRGDMSFIGPRPEHVDLARVYEQIPYYGIRHITKPGIIGWAQLNYRPSEVIRNWKSGPYQEGSFQKGWHPPHPTFFVKKKIYDKYGSFRTDMSTYADYELMLRFLEKDKISSSYIPRVLAKMRNGGQSNRSYRTLFKANLGCYKAFKANGLEVSNLFIFKKPLSKLGQYFKNKIEK